MTPRILFAVLALGLVHAGPPSVEVLLSQPETLRAMARKEIRVESSGQTETYAGVPLVTILDRRSGRMEGMPGLRDLADAVLLVRGKDDYQAAVAAVSVAMDIKADQYLVADVRNGQTIPPQLIIPADPKHVRWVKDISSIKLVRLGGLLPMESTPK